MEQINTPEPEFWQGIDVSKTTLDAHLLPGGAEQHVDNTDAGHQVLLEKLKSLKGQVKVLLEATGGLERPLVAALAAAGIAVIVVNPRQARRFAEALSANPAKTDRADARVLALMCQSLPLQPRPVPTQAQQELAELVARRRQLVEMLGREKMRLAQTASVRVRQDVAETVQWIESRLKDLDNDLGLHLDTMPGLKLVQEIVQQEKGVGLQTSRTLVACLPELGQLNRRQIASLVGVAPVACDSGSSSAPRHVRGGRGDVRAALWMAAFTARQRNEKIRELFERLIKKGKPYKVAMVACMRKLLTILNAMVQRHLTGGLPCTPP